MRCGAKRITLMLRRPTVLTPRASRVNPVRRHKTCTPLVVVVRRRDEPAFFVHHGVQVMTNRAPRTRGWVLSLIGLLAAPLAAGAQEPDLRPGQLRNPAEQSQPAQTQQERSQSEQSQPEKSQQEQGRSGFGQPNQPAQEREGADQNQAKSRDAAMQLFEQLNLREDQKKQVQEIIRKYDRQAMEADRKFHELHMQAVAMEAAIMAAMDKSLSEQQRQTLARRFGDRQDAGRAEEGREVERAFRPDRPSRGEESPESNRPDSPLQNQQEDRGERFRQAGQEEARQQNPERDQPRDAQSQLGQRQDAGLQDQPQADGWSLIVIQLAPADARYRELGLSDEQQRRHQALHATAGPKLQQVWGQLRSLHSQMVMAESQKLEELEKVLDEDQLQRLHSFGGHGENPEREQSTGNKAQQPETRD